MLQYSPNRLNTYLASHQSNNLFQLTLSRLQIHIDHSVREVPNERRLAKLKDSWLHRCPNSNNNNSNSSPTSAHFAYPNNRVPVSGRRVPHCPELEGQRTAWQLTRNLFARRPTCLSASIPLSTRDLEELRDLRGQLVARFRTWRLSIGVRKSAARRP